MNARFIVRRGGRHSRQGESQEPVAGHRRLRSVAVVAALALGALGGAGWAIAQVSDIIAPDGTINGCYLQKTGALRVVAASQACAKGELPIQWNQAGPKGDTGAPGATGDTGPPGAPGQALGSLVGVPCGTFSSSVLNGFIKVAVLIGGKLELTCVSNVPVLEVYLLPQYQDCFGCFYTYPSVVEVDGSGVPVSGGFTCSNGGSSVLGVAYVCRTFQFAENATVRLRVSAPAGYAGGWSSGCDSIIADTCTVTIKAGPQTVIAFASTATG